MYNEKVFYTLFKQIAFKLRFNVGSRIIGLLYIEVLNEIG